MGQVIVDWSLKSEAVNDLLPEGGPRRLLSQDYVEFVKTNFSLDVFHTSQLTRFVYVLDMDTAMTFRKFIIDATDSVRKQVEPLKV